MMEPTRIFDERSSRRVTLCIIGRTRGDRGALSDSLSSGQYSCDPSSKDSDSLTLPDKGDRITCFLNDLVPTLHITAEHVHFLWGRLCETDPISVYGVELMFSSFSNTIPSSVLKPEKDRGNAYSCEKISSSLSLKSASSPFFNCLFGVAPRLFLTWSRCSMVLLIRQIVSTFTVSLRTHKARSLHSCHSKQNYIQICALFTKNAQKSEGTPLFW